MELLRQELLHRKIYRMSGACSPGYKSCMQSWLQELLHRRWEHGVLVTRAITQNVGAWSPGYKGCCTEGGSMESWLQKLLHRRWELGVLATRAVTSHKVTRFGTCYTKGFRLGLACLAEHFWVWTRPIRCSDCYKNK